MSFQYDLAVRIPAGIVVDMLDLLSGKDASEQKLNAQRAKAGWRNYRIDQLVMEQKNRVEIGVRTRLKCSG